MRKNGALLVEQARLLTALCRGMDIRGALLTVGLAALPRGALYAQVERAPRVDAAGCSVVSLNAPASARDSLSADSTGDARSSGTPVGRGPAIVLRAAASAREVRFATQPRIVVRLCGGVLDSVRVLERRNLPEPVQPGVVYKDVYVAVEILGHLNARCLGALITRTDAPNRSACAHLELRDTTVRRPPP